MVAASGTQAWTREIIANIHNKREDDFLSLKEYNDYLEEVEDMTFDLIEGRNVAAIEAKIAKYQDENAELIMINRARKAEELAEAPDSNDMGSAQNSQAHGVQGQYAPAQPRPPMGQPVRVQPGQMDSLLQSYEMTIQGSLELRELVVGALSLVRNGQLKRRLVVFAFGSICI